MLNSFQAKRKILSPKEVTNWNNEVIKLEHYSFFHTLEWAEVLTESYSYKPVYFCLLRNSHISAVVSAMEIRSKLTGKRLVSLPFSDFCEPLFSSIDESGVLKKIIIDYCENNNFKFIEFRTSETKFPFETEKFRIDLRHIIELTPNEDELFKHLTDNTRRNIKSAVKEGLKITEDNSYEGIKNFYHLQCITRRKHGLPPQPKIFFDNVHKYIISKNKGSILFAKLNNEPVAALMFFTFGKKVLFKFGASLTDNLPKGANHLLMWEGIKKYSELGYKEFDLGRTETNHEGLRRFKLGFGADERIIYTTRYDIAKKTFISVDTKTTGIHNKIFKNIPIPILKFIGNTIYKHMG